MLKVISLFLQINFVVESCKKSTNSDDVTTHFRLPVSHTIYNEIGHAMSRGDYQSSKRQHTFYKKKVLLVQKIPMDKCLTKLYFLFCFLCIYVTERSPNWNGSSRLCLLGDIRLRRGFFL